MTTNPLRRWIAAAAVCAIGLSIALWLGAVAVAAAAAMLAGLLAAAIASLPYGQDDARDEPEIDEVPPLPATPSLLEAIDDPLLIVRDRRVMFANAAARAVLGEHISGTDVRLAIRHPAAAERLVERSRGKPGEPATRIELVGLGEHGRRWLMATTLLDDGSMLVRLTDKSAAHASEQMRVDFVANASHELRTPLATILGFLETLQDDGDAAPDAKTRARFLRIMFDEARRIQQLVDDLISLSRIEAERFSLPRESVDLLPVVETVRAACGQLLADRGGSIVIEGDEASVLGDRTQLAQMIQNLIVNALKYGRAGTPVTVRFEDAGPELVRMSVIDIGEGIAPEHLPRLTERFYRADPSRSRAMGGTGLGLAIVKHIVHRHRGRLDIRSKPGEGTCVTVLLPRSPDPLSSKSHQSVTVATAVAPTKAADPA
jgi:two-component system phosphate regulon sensor histidine kinase PhoR